MQCSQKVGQKKWSHNSSQKTSRTSTPTPPLQKGLLKVEISQQNIPKPSQKGAKRFKTAPNVKTPDFFLTTPTPWRRRHGAGGGRAAAAVTAAAVAVAATLLRYPANYFIVCSI